MRFGVHLFQLSDLVPPKSSRSQVAANILKYSPVKTVKSFHKAGFQIAEISTDLANFIPNSLDKMVIKKLIEVKEDTGMIYTAHLPLWSIELSSPYPSVRRGSVEATIEAIRAVEPLDPEVYVLHATGALAAEFYHMNVNRLAIDYTMKMFKENAILSLEEILDEVKIPGRKIAIETINFPLEMTLEIAEKLDLSICFDVGHVLAGFSGNIDFFKALDLCLPRLAEIHLHDSPLMGEDDIPKFDQDHITLGTGALDIKHFFEVLRENSFDGPIIYELSLDQAIDSNLILQKLL